MEYFKKFWAWSVSSPINAWLVLTVIGFVVNSVTRVVTKDTWKSFSEKHPRIAGILLVFKGFFIEVSPIFRGIWGVFTGQLKEQAKDVTPKDVVDAALKADKNDGSSLDAPERKDQIK